MGSWQCWDTAAFIFPSQAVLRGSGTQPRGESLRGTSQQGHGSHHFHPLLKRSWSCLRGLGKAAWHLKSSLFRGMAIFYMVSLLLHLQHAACSCPEGFVLGVRIAAALELPEINYQLLTRGALLPLRVLSCPCWGRSMQMGLRSTPLPPAVPHATLPSAGEGLCCGTGLSRARSGGEGETPGTGWAVEVGAD